MVIEFLSSGGGLDIFPCAELSSAIRRTYPPGIKRFMDVSRRRKKLGSIPLPELHERLDTKSENVIFAFESTGKK